MACGQLSQEAFVFFVVDGPLRVKTSDEVAGFFQQDCTANDGMFSLDAEDLFYSMPHDVLLI